MAENKIYPASEIQKHTNKGDLWLVIHNSVYNVSEFMEDHPGGADALLDQGGVDATSAFEDVGHSDDARTMMEDFKIGKADKLPPDNRTSSADFMKLDRPASTSHYSGAFLVLLVVLIGLWYARS